MEVNVPKVSYIDEKKSVSGFNPKRGKVFIVVFLVLSFVMGLAGGAGAILLLGSSESLQTLFKVKDSALNVITTKTEKLKLEESSAIIDGVEKVSPAVVSITTSRNVQDFFGQTVEQEGGGTGFIVTNDGLILTNKHVAQSGDALTAILSDGKTYPAEVAALDPTNDLAILKIDASGLPVVDLGDSNDLKVGQWVVAIGNALGEFQNTVTAGIISARERQLVVTGSSQQEQLNNLLQTDAAINSGNSGGPLVNLSGQVVGINTAVANNAQNIGFAIPISQAKTALESYKENGKIIKAQLGVRYVTLDKDIARNFNLSVDYGAFIIAGRGQSAVVADGPADKAGLKERDIILEIGGDKVDENHPLASLIQKYQPGDEVDIKYKRDDKESTIKVKLGSTE